MTVIQSRINTRDAAFALNETKQRQEVTMALELPWLWFWVILSALLIVGE